MKSFSFTEGVINPKYTMFQIISTSITEMVCNLSNERNNKDTNSSKSRMTKNRNTNVFVLFCLYTFMSVPSSSYSFPVPEVPVLPQSSTRNVLVTSALPYVNNVPHLGNLIGCVLSADVFARYCRAKGYTTLYVCGTDEYGTATETKALQEKTTPQEICDKYFKLHRDIYKWFDIGFDIFGRTSTLQQKEVSQEIFKNCDENGFTEVNTLEQLFCQACERFLADRFVSGICPTCKYVDARGDQCDACGRLLNATELINPQCAVCKNPPILKSTKHIFLNLPALEPKLDEWFRSASEKGDWSANAVSVTQTWIRDGLKPRCITRDLKWGVPVPKPGFEDKVFYVWFDAPIGYLSITALYTPDWRKWWLNPENVQLYQFMAKDNIPFHTVIFPSTLIATKQPYTMLHHISSTEYLNYEGGKFSKSRGVGVFGDNAIESGIPCEVWRYYLLVNRPEVSDSVFLWDDFAAKNNSELLNNLGNFVNRTLSFIAAKFGRVIPALHADTIKDLEKETIVKINEQVKIYFDSMEKVQLKDGIKTAMAISRLGNEYMQLAKAWELFKSEPIRCGQSVNFSVQIIYLLVSLLQPYIPSFSTKVAAQLNLPISNFHLQFDSFQVFDNLFPEGHVLGDVFPIFKKIEAAEVENWRFRYAGKQVSSGDAVSASPYSNAIEFPLDLAIGRIEAVTEISDSDKLYLLQVNLGSHGVRPIVSGLKAHYSAVELKNKLVTVVLNLKPVKMAGVQSCGLVLTAMFDGVCGLLTTDELIELGTRVAPKGSKVVAPAKFDLKKQLPLLPFVVDDQGYLNFEQLQVQIGNPNLGMEQIPIKVEKVRGPNAKIC